MTGAAQRGMHVGLYRIRGKISRKGRKEGKVTSRISQYGQGLFRALQRFV
jgi:hypothetical protein